MAKTITITNPEYIQFKDAAGALHYYQHYPPIERKDVTDFIFYGTKPYGYDVRSSISKIGLGFTTTFCLYLYYTNNLTDFKKSKLKGSFAESTFNTTGSLNVDGLEKWGMASAYSLYSKRLLGTLGLYRTSLTDTWTRPDRSGSIHLFNSDVNYNGVPTITDDDWENLVIYTDAWRYVFGVGRYYTESNMINSQYIYLTCNPTMTTENLKAELIDPATDWVVCTANKTTNMAVKPYIKLVDWVRLRISNGKTSYDRKIIFSSIPTTSYKLTESQTAHINWQGQWGWIKKTSPTVGSTPILRNYINTFYGVNQLVQGGLRCNDKTIIDYKQTNNHTPTLYSFVISKDGYQHIAENPTARGEFFLPNFLQLAGYVDSRIFYYNLDDPYKAFVQS